MGLDVVLNEILTRGADEAQKVVRNAEAERQRVLDAAEGEADEQRARTLQETRLQLDAMRREHQSASEFEVRRRLLTTQRELNEDFRRRVLEALRSLPKNDREKTLSKLVKLAQLDAPKGTVHANREDLAFLTSASGYKRGQDLQIVGGFQVESEDGTVLLDYRFETLLENAWKDMLAESQKLFEA